MGDEISVDTDKLGLAIPQVDELAARMNAIRGTLNGTLQGLGECWGGPDDSIGKSFQESYQPAYDQLDLGLVGTHDAFGSTVDRLGTTMHGYNATEDGNIVNARIPATDPTEHHPLP